MGHASMEFVLAIEGSLEPIVVWLMDQRCAQTTARDMVSVTLPLLSPVAFAHHLTGLGRHVILSCLSAHQLSTTALVTEFADPSMRLTLKANGFALARSDSVVLHAAKHVLSAQTIAQDMEFAKGRSAIVSPGLRVQIALELPGLMPAPTTALDMVVVAKSMGSSNVFAKRVTPGSLVCSRTQLVLTTAVEKESACQMASAFAFPASMGFLVRLLSAIALPATTVPPTACVSMVCASVSPGLEAPTVRLRATPAVLGTLGATPTNSTAFVSMEAVCARRANGKALAASSLQIPQLSLR